MTILHVLLWGFCLGIASIGYSYVEKHSAFWPLFILGLTVAACLLLPWWMSRLLIIPLGLPKLAYQVNRLGAVAWDGDMDSGPAIAALLATLRTRKRDAAFLEKLERELQSQLRLRSATVFGFALLAAARGDFEAARTLASSIRTLPPKVTLWPVPTMANEWLMIEAAAQGDWAAVHDRGRRASRLTWMSLFLFGVSSRLLGVPYWAAPLRLWTTWMLAGNWRSTWPLLRRGLHPPPVTAFAAPESLSIDGNDLLRDALGLHVAALRTPPKQLLAEHVRLLGRAWDAALDGAATRARFVSRATSLAVLPSEDHLDSVRETAVGDLVAILREAKLPFELWSDDSVMLEDVASTLRDELLEGIESASSALIRRAKEKRALPAIDEWREWIALRTQYEEAGQLCGLGFRRLAFSQVHHEACNYAVWLFNVREEKPIANAIFTWLLAEAKSVGDEAAITLQQGNVKAGCGF